MQTVPVKKTRLADHRDVFDIKMKAFVAGGAILSNATKNEIADYDIYPFTRKDAADIIYDLTDSSDYFIVNITDRAVTLKCNSITKENGERGIVQVMFFDEFQTAEKIFETFDFTVCMAAQNMETGEYTFHDDFWQDVASKSLRFNTGTRYPLNSLLRIPKYNRKGYYISKTENTKIALTIAKKGMPTSWKELENEIGGTYGRNISIARQDMEFSFENAVEVLESIGIIEYYEQDDSDMMSKFPMDVLVELVEHGSLNVKAYDGKYEHKTQDEPPNRLVIFDNDGSLIGELRGEQRLIPAVLDNITNITDDREISFYVRLTEKDLTAETYFGRLHPTSHNGPYYEKKDVYKVTCRASDLTIGEKTSIFGYSMTGMDAPEGEFPLASVKLEPVAK